MPPLSTREKTHRRVPPCLPLGRGLRPERGHHGACVGGEGEGGRGGGVREVEGRGRGEHRRWSSSGSGGSSRSSSAGRRSRGCRHQGVRRHRCSGFPREREGESGERKGSARLFFFCSWAPISHFRFFCVSAGSERKSDDRRKKKKRRRLSFTSLFRGFLSLSSLSLSLPSKTPCASPCARRRRPRRHRRARPIGAGGSRRRRLRRRRRRRRGR